MTHGPSCMGHCLFILDWSSFHGISMYVKAYLDLSLKSLVVCCVASWPVRLGAWPGGSWLPWRAVPCLLFVCCFFKRLL